MVNSIEKLRGEFDEMFFANSKYVFEEVDSEFISMEILTLPSRIENLPNSFYNIEYIEKWISEAKNKLKAMDESQINKKSIWYFERMIYVLELGLVGLKAKNLAHRN